MPQLHKHDKNLAKKLSPETLKILNNFETIKKLYAEFQTKGRITEELFDELKISDNVNLRGETTSEIRLSDFVPCQRYQILNTELHIEKVKNQKEKISNQKIK